MSLADYYGRAALAAAQVIAGFDEDSFSATLGQTTVGLSIAENSCHGSEGRAIADLVVRLLARLYPRLQFEVGDASFRSGLEELANRINPNIELVDGGAETGISIGLHGDVFPTTIFAGSNRWVGRTSRSSPLSVTDSSNPFGAGVAACFAAADLFRLLLMKNAESDEVSFSAWSGERRLEDDGPDIAEIEPFGDAVLVGVGAIGQSVVWSLARSSLKGRLHLVDPEPLDSSNLQRYVLSMREDVGERKTDLAAAAFTTASIEPVSHGCAWERFVEGNGYDWPIVLAALDTSTDRRSVQASLPRRVGNAWTQPGDLGLSIHGRFGTEAACLSCLYQRAEPTLNEDQVVAAALGVPSLQKRVRDLLHLNSPLDLDFLKAVADGLQIARDAVGLYAGRTIRELYVEGLCGGALIGLNRVGVPKSELHVPLAHQSALAGVLLGAALVRLKLDTSGDETVITRIDVLRPLGTHLTQSTAASYPACICRDRDFVAVYDAKWPTSKRRPASTRTQAGTMRAQRAVGHNPES